MNSSHSQMRQEWTKPKLLYVYHSSRSSGVYCSVQTKKKRQNQFIDSQYNYYYYYLYRKAATISRTCLPRTTVVSNPQRVRKARMFPYGNRIVVIYGNGWDPCWVWQLLLLLRYHHSRIPIRRPAPHWITFSSRGRSYHEI